MLEGQPSLLIRPFLKTCHVSEQVDLCVATRHLTVEATKPGATLHVSKMFRHFHKTCHVSEQVD